MKRLLTVIALFAITIGIFATQGSVNAAPPILDGPSGNDAIRCTTEWKNKTFEKNSVKHNRFKSSSCNEDNGGKCAAKVNGSNVRTTCEAGADGSADEDVEGSGNPSETGSTTIEQSKDPATEANCTKDSCPLIKKYVNPFIATLTVLVGLAVVIGIIIGAIQVMTSAGDPQQAAKGKNHIRDAIIAVVVYVFLFAGLQFILPGGFL